jgi:CRP/FNR family cyclic AMP-dependent transcriptional regulator
VRSPLAYWPPGHFIGGPEIFGGGTHIWSGEAVEDSRVLFLPGPTVQALVTRLPSFASCLVEGLVAKGKCYSAVVQMLGTRSVIERLAIPPQYRRTLRRRGWRAHCGASHDDPWPNRQHGRRHPTMVTMTLDGFRKSGIISVTRQAIVIDRPDLLQAIVGREFDG